MKKSQLITEKTSVMASEENIRRLAKWVSKKEEIPIDGLDTKTKEELIAELQISGVISSWRTWKR